MSEFAQRFLGIRQKAARCWKRASGKAPEQDILGISLDNLIGAAEEQLRHREPKLLCRLQVEHQLAGRRLHYR